MARGKNRGRGGKRTPRDPAATSGVGRGSRRTDGGPGAAVANPATNPRVQPIRAIPSEDREFGSRQESVDLQRAAPLPAPGAPGAQPQPAAGGGGSSDRLRGLAERIFADSERPDEPLSAGGVPLPAQPPEPDAPLIANLLPLLEFRASQADSTHAFRAWVQRQRARVPLGFERLMPPSGALRDDGES